MRSQSPSREASNAVATTTRSPEAATTDFPLTALPADLLECVVRELSVRAYGRLAQASHAWLAATISRGALEQVVTAEVVRRLKDNEDVGTLTNDVAEDGTPIGPRFMLDMLCIKCPTLVLPTGITSLGSNSPGPFLMSGEGKLFCDCESLRSITLPDGLTLVGKAAFCGCSSLTTVILPTSLTTIGRGGFQYCTSLTQISLPEGLVSIGEDAFYGCSKLVSVTIPPSVTRIGRCAFRRCPRLDAPSRASIEAVNAHAFGGAVMPSPVW